MSILKQTLHPRILVIVMSLVAFAPNPSAHAQTLDRIKESGEIRLGYRADARPFSFRDDSGNAAGYSVALCQQIVDAVQSELGLAQLTTRHILVSSAERFVALEEGQIDVLCGAATVTLGRRATMSFSMPIFLSGMSAMVRSDAPADLKAIVVGEEPEFRPLWRASAADILKKRVIAVIEGTAPAGWLQTHIKSLKLPAHVIPYQDYDAAADGVSNGRADILFGDRAVLLDIAARQPNKSELVVLDRQFTYQAISFAIERGDYEFQLLIDKTLSEIYRSGEINSIYAQFFGEPDETARSLFVRAALPE